MKKESLVKMCDDMVDLVKKELAKLDPKTKMPGVLIDKNELQKAPNFNFKPGSAPSPSQMSDSVRQTFGSSAPAPTPTPPPPDTKKMEPLKKPVPKGVDPEKFDICVDQVKSKGSADNAYAVCSSSLKKDQYEGLHTKMKEGFSKAGYLKKDDKPHQPGSPQERSHAVAEGKESLPDAIGGLKSKGDKKDMLGHLRTLKDPSQQRSPDNVLKDEKMKKDGPTLNPQAVQGFIQGFKGVK